MLLSKLSFRLAALAVTVTVIAAWSLTSTTTAAEDPLKLGKIELKSAGALEFGPDNVLFIADSEGSAVYAVDVAIPAGASAPSEVIADIDEKIAALLGTTARDVLIRDMTVHRPSGTTFLSIMRGRGDDARPVILSITGKGDVAEVRLDSVRHARLAINDAPEDAKWGRWDKRTLTVTDLEFIGGELYIAGLSNEEFASTLRRAAYPFTGDVAATGLEIYHGAHGEYETHAPIFSFIPYDIEGETHLLAGYLCTPLVTFPLDEVRQKSKLRGKTIAELGWGNIPTDIVAYERGGEQHVLVANNSRGTMKITGADIRAANKGEGISTEAGPRTGVDDHTVPIGTVAQLADLDQDHLLMLGRSMESGALYLRPLAKARL